MLHSHIVSTIARVLLHSRLCRTNSGTPIGNGCWLWFRARKHGSVQWFSYPIIGQTGRTGISGVPTVARWYGSVQCHKKAIRWYRSAIPVSDRPFSIVRCGLYGWQSTCNESPPTVCLFYGLWWQKLCLPVFSGKSRLLRLYTFLCRVVWLRANVCLKGLSKYSVDNKGKSIEFSFFAGSNQLFPAISLGFRIKFLFMF